MRQPITRKEPWVFFLPLIAMTQMMQISHSMVHAFLARMKAPTIALAGYNAAFSAHVAVASLQFGAPNVAIAFIKDKRSFWRMIYFFWAVMALPMVFLLAIALTPLGQWLFGRLMGASPEVTAQARLATLVLTINAPVVIFRNVATGLILMSRKTLHISVATIVRLSSLVGFLFLTSRFLNGAVVGAVSLTACMWLETVFMLIMAYSFYAKLPQQHGEPVPYRQYLKFSWPLMYSQMVENLVMLVSNAFLGRLLHPDLALAAYGVSYGLMRLLLSPLRNLMQTAQTLVRSHEDMGVILPFAAQVTAFFVLLVGLMFYTPFRPIMLERVMGLTPDLAMYVAPAMLLSAGITIVWGWSSLFRGLLAAARRTGSLATSATGSLIVTVLVCSATLVWPEANGAVIGLCAMLAAFTQETLVLGWNVFAYRRAGQALLFPSDRPQAETPAA